MASWPSFERLPSPESPNGRNAPVRPGGTPFGRAQYPAGSHIGAAHGRPEAPSIIPREDAPDCVICAYELRARIAIGSTSCDAETRGFGVRVSADGRISYVVHYRFEGRQPGYRIGAQGSPWTPETARTEAPAAWRSQPKAAIPSSVGSTTGPHSTSPAFATCSVLGTVIRTRWLDTPQAAARIGLTAGTLQTHRWMGTDLSSGRSGGEWFTRQKPSMLEKAHMLSKRRRR